jgi:hypothetical protein
MAAERACSPDAWRNPACGPGRGVSLCPPHILITAFEQEPGGECRLRLGAGGPTRSGMRVSARHLLPHTQRPEVMVADAGDPRDATFLQAHKACSMRLGSSPTAGVFCSSREWRGAVPTWSDSGGCPRLISREGRGGYALHATALAFRSVIEESMSLSGREGSVFFRRQIQSFVGGITRCGGWNAAGLPRAWGG